MCGLVGRQGLLLGGGSIGWTARKRGSSDSGSLRKKSMPYGARTRSSHTSRSVCPVARRTTSPVSAPITQGVVAVLVSGGVDAGQKEGDVVVHRSVRGQGVDDRCA